MFKRSLYMCLWMTLITGVGYPLLITLLAQITMPSKANGSFVSINEKVVGSHLIGQEFTSDKYFWGRPSASHYDSLQSGGSNLGPISSKLKEQVQKRRTHLQSANPAESATPIPEDLLFASGSGLDPHITLQAAEYQKERIAKARGFNETDKRQLDHLIEHMTEKRDFKFMGQPCLNVLRLNISLDELTKQSKQRHE